jgi:hypothetical protein
MVGRIYFQMPNDINRTSWTGYVCSGTTVTDSKSDRSIIITAAHCVYDDDNKAFARNVLFIPSQEDTTAGRTDTTCSNDLFGCWVPSFGVVDVEMYNKTWPDFIPWDYVSECYYGSIERRFSLKSMH